MKNLLHTGFSIKDLSDLKYFLGMEIARTTKGRLAHSKSGTTLSDPSLYRRLMGKLLYLIHTRPDLSFFVGHHSQFVSGPTNDHLDGAKRISRYLKGTISMGVFFSSAGTNFNIKGYTDSDWGGCPDTRRSVSGYYFYIGNTLISWKSKKQQVISRSFVEAEYKAMTLPTCEAQWLIYLLNDLYIHHPQ
ncbi:PREDICTED: uncharacterized protein LOC109356303 [Lupinus angustifolius]|uniref:uncharacterized protein LOC109356303 n=1 Tax=Lupinus angustifolius TaxID=3871 RepID=UPI00092EAC64|nr:PREDICTED: uncharacterized protein LOC109356303 [Lupinus angustifolius]